MADVEHSVLTGSDLHEPKGIASASANEVYVADGAASGAFAQIAPSNVVMVHSASDLPAAAAGVRTLVASTTYHIVGAVSIGSDRLVLANNTRIQGSDRKIDSLTTTSSGAMLSLASGVSTHLSNITFTCSSGSFISQVGSTTEVLTLEFVIVSSNTLGSFDAPFAFNMLESNVTGTAAGFDFTGACGQLLLDTSRVTVSTSSAICVDLGTATFDLISINVCDFQNASGVTGIDIAASGANLNSDKLGVISQCRFLTAATATNYVDGDDQWIIEASPHAGDTSAEATGNIEGSALTNTFSGGTGIGNEEAVNFGTAFVAALASKFTVSNAGLFTYNGILDTSFHATANIFSEIGGGAARQYSFQWAKNGTVIIPSLSRIENDGNIPSSCTCTTVVSLSEGDTLQLFVRADTATTALVIDTVSISIIHH